MDAHDHLSLITRTSDFVRQTLQDAEGSHDWFHVERVWKNAKLIGRPEGVDMLVTELAALLHDIADAKFHGGDEEVGPRTARLFLEREKIDPTVIDHVERIIRHMSFRSSLEGEGWTSPELFVVRDADRLDAIGAIGIARAFSFGGSRNRPLYDPSIPPNEAITREKYIRAESPTLNHFYEKLLHLRERLHTSTARQIAEERHVFMLRYLEQFHREWNGEG